MTRDFVFLRPLGLRLKLEMKKAKNIRDSEVEQHISVVTQQMKQLDTDLSVLISLIETLDEQQKEKLANKLTLQGTALMKSLLNLTN